MKIPDFSYEKKYRKQGFAFVIGIDEVGRGPLAGPVIACACMLKNKIKNAKIKNKFEGIYKLGIDDSKKLSPKKREELAREISKYFHIGIGKSSVSDINKLGIVKATERAMTCAIKSLIAQNPKSLPRRQTGDIRTPKQSSIFIDFSNIFLLVDGFRLKHFIFKDFKNQEAIIKGDGKSISIAAASIMAKVYRDKLMTRLAGKYPQYSWERNKGYGTGEHISAIKLYGLTKHHRFLFVDGIINSK